MNNDGYRPVATALVLAIGLGVLKAVTPSPATATHQGPTTTGQTSGAPCGQNVVTPMKR